ncbi:MAG: HlyD family efflux transporter periplasmic adaptor subunit, partial [Planctomycetota bacterium]
MKRFYKPEPWMALLSVFIFACGCSKPEEAQIEPRPRPVVTQKLAKRSPPNSALVSASVASWKTEQIGFEINGRVKWVLEPNEEIEGRVFDEAGQTISVGTAIGQLESERYELQVAKSTAEVKRVEQNLIAARTELQESIPAQIEAAEASKELAQIEFERSGRLFEQSAGAEADVDRDRSNYKNAISQLKQLNASKKAKEAEIERLRNEVLQAKQGLRDAQRNLEDCTLYSSFNGQIAEVAVVPGSVVAAGAPVATVQMMNPIKIELEVSADDSRRLQRTERLPVSISLPDGSSMIRQGYLYLVDPVADSLTRTFTVTLLVMNEKLNPEQVSEVTATTQDIWRLDFKFLPSADEDALFVDENAILADSQGCYLWMVTNATIESRDTGERYFKVRKLRIRKVEKK